MPSDRAASASIHFVAHHLLHALGQLPPDLVFFVDDFVRAARSSRVAFVWHDMSISSYTLPTPVVVYPRDRNENASDLVRPCFRTGYDLRDIIWDASRDAEQT